MRWKYEPDPPLGTRRIVRRFAWLPVRIAADDSWLWLEHYQAVQELQAWFEFYGWVTLCNRFEAAKESE